MQQYQFHDLEDKFLNELKIPSKRVARIMHYLRLLVRDDVPHDKLMSQMMTELRLSEAEVMAIVGDALHDLGERRSLDNMAVKEMAELLENTAFRSLN
jgi:hypothetical protein